MNDPRKAILKVLLFCLAFTAAAGILAVMTDNESIGRIVSTGLWGTFCAMLMLGFASRSDKKLTQKAVTLGMVIIIIEFFAVLALIWDVPRSLGSGDLEERLGVFCLMLVPWGTLGMIFLSLHASAFNRVAGISGLTSTGFSFVIALIAVWNPGQQHYYYSDERWWLVAWSLNILGILIAMCLVGQGTPVTLFNGSKPEPEQGSTRPWRWVGVATGLVAAFLLIYIVWQMGELDEREPLSAAYLLIGSVTLLVAFLNLVLLAPLLPHQRWLGLLTVAVGVVTIGLIASIGFAGEANETLGRFIAAGMIATACASIALIVVARLNMKTTFGDAPTADLRIALTCPRCRRDQQLPPGPAQCADCGLKIELKIEDPRCTQCGYLLYMLDTDQCPECGTAIVTATATAS